MAKFSSPESTLMAKIVSGLGTPRGLAAMGDIPDQKANNDKALERLIRKYWMTISIGRFLINKTPSEVKIHLVKVNWDEPGNQGGIETSLEPQERETRSLQIKSQGTVADTTYRSALAAIVDPIEFTLLTAGYPLTTRLDTNGETGANTLHYDGLSHEGDPAAVFKVLRLGAFQLSAANGNIPDREKLRQLIA